MENRKKQEARCNQEKSHLTENTMNITVATENLRPGIRSLLTENHLPAVDLPENLDTFYVSLSDKENIAGVIGMEVFGTVALLRSMVVDSTFRNKNIASNLVSTLESEAMAKGIEEIYLLTETAEKYFSKKGYTVIQRKEVPASVQSSSEFIHTCPTSATVMKKKIREVSGER